jgi:selT/selW/selH-like putative selenoprotein
VSLATELNSQGHDAQAVSGKNGQFDVVVDGALVFSKKDEGRFPEQDEITAKL